MNAAAKVNNTLKNQVNYIWFSYFFSRFWFQHCWFRAEWAVPEKKQNGCLEHGTSSGIEEITCGVAKV